MFNYLCYGLRVRSDVEIPEFLEAPPLEAIEPPDVDIRLCAIEQSVPEVNAHGMRVSVTPEETHFFWEEAGHYRVRGGKLLLINPAAGADADLYRLPVLGIVFAALLAQRGLQILHASAVNVGGVAVGLVGAKGMGKSTTAAALHRAGHQALSDDVLALSFNGDGGVDMVPGFPHLKLWPQAVEHIGGDPDHTPRLHSRVEKRAFFLRGEFPVEPLPMARLYLLEWGDETAVHDVGLREAFSSLVPHTFARRYAPDSPQTTGYLLESCSRLVQSVPVKRLVRKPALPGLHEIVEVVNADLASNSEK